MTVQKSIINPGKNVSIKLLAEQISSLSSQISSYLDERSLPQPSFEADGGEVPEEREYEALRATLNDAALDLLSLVNGPKTVLRELFFEHYDLAALQVAFDRGYFNHIPLADGTNQGAISVAEIAAKSGMDEGRTGAILKLLATRRIFQQVQKGDGVDYFKHTAISASLARDADWHALGDMKLDDMFKASSGLSAIINKSPYVSNTDNSAFTLNFGTRVYQYYDQNPQKGKRFAQAMRSWSKVNEKDTELRNSFPWASLGSGKVVDVGGGSGHISIGLARVFPELRFVVQDNSPVQLTHGQDNLDGRVSFQQHNFFTPQPIHDASVFFLRQIFHNYNDEDSTKILRALIPALEKSGPDTFVLVNDIILPDVGTSTKFEEHLLRQTDVSMMVIFGAKQRSQRDWTSLFHTADPRFELVRVQRNPLGVGLLQFRLSSSV